MASPPKPKLALRIGVTGHRPNRFDDAAQKKVAAELRRLFSHVIEAAKSLALREKAFFSTVEPEICVVSALAEGADRVVARAGQDAGFALDVLLPFAAATYEADFLSEESKADFRHLLRQARAVFALPGEKSSADPSVANRAYETAGLMTLRQCDLLITVWDGKPASGRGGTEAIVQKALASGLTVLRFDQHGNGPYLLEQRDGPVDACTLAASASLGTVAGKEVIATLVERLCAPPAEQPDQTDNARARLLQFFYERERRFTALALFHPLLLWLCGGKKPTWRIAYLHRYADGAALQWKEYWKALGSGSSFETRIRAIIMARCAWADGLANYYGQMHRSGYIGNYTFAALAVACAALSMLEIGGAWPAIGEAFAIAIIAGSTWWGKRRCWHPRWVDYRQLSAELRHMRALVLTGSTNFDTHLASIEDSAVGAQWVNWYCRMTVREIGVLDCVVDAAYLDLARRTIALGEVDDQRVYHARNAALMDGIARRLERLSTWSFVAPFVLCLLEILFHRLEWEAVRVWIALPTVVLPAIGAGLFGIRIHGDFHGSAERSERMEGQLKRVVERLQDTTMTFSTLSAVTENVEMLMASELDDWGVVYRGRPLTLPA